ncbi:MAG: antibiotic biosynthesis monooxygenase [Pseudolysinimonas sp.]
MIVRTSEAWIAPGKRDEFMAILVDLVASFPDRYPGLESHRILIDRTDPDRVIYQSVWGDVDAVAGFAGDNWQTEAVTFPGEADLLREPLRLRHFDTRDLQKQEELEDFAPLD